MGNFPTKVVAQANITHIVRDLIFLIIKLRLLDHAPDEMFIPSIWRNYGVKLASYRDRNMMVLQLHKYSDSV